MQGSLEQTLWFPVDAEGRFVLRAPGPGRYRLLVSAQIDPMAYGFVQDARLLALDLVEIREGEPTVWERDLPVGGLRVRRNEGDHGRLLVWNGPGGVSGVLGIDRWDDRLEYRIPCVPAGPVEVVRLKPGGTLEVLATVFVPPGSTAEIDLR